MASSAYGGNFQDSSRHASPKPLDTITEELEPSCECQRCGVTHQLLDELETSLEELVEGGSEISRADLNFILDDPYAYSLLANCHNSGPRGSDADSRDGDTVESRFAHSLRALADWLRKLRGQSGNEDEEGSGETDPCGIHRSSGVQGEDIGECNQGGGQGDADAELGNRRGHGRGGDRGGSDGSDGSGGEDGRGDGSGGEGGGGEGGGGEGGGGEGGGGEGGGGEGSGGRGNGEVRGDRQGQRATGRGRGRGRGRGSEEGGATIRVPCVRGGVFLIQVRLNRLQRSLYNHFGPEGLGEENDADDQEIPDDPDPDDFEREQRLDRQHSMENSSEHSIPTPEEPRLAQVTSGILLSIASTARDCILEDTGHTKIATGVHPVLHSLTTGVAPALSLSQTEPTTPLILATKRCHVTEILDSSIQLNYWVNVIIFASQVSR